MTQLLTAPRKSVTLVSELPREPFFPLPGRRGDSGSRLPLTEDLGCFLLCIYNRGRVRTAARGVPDLAFTRPLILPFT
jgi:hypothetical protein